MPDPASGDPVSRHAPHRVAEAARAEEESLRVRWEAHQIALRQRFDAPINRATEITQRTLGWFPIRVWRHFLQNNGFLLSAGVSYQALFAFFAAIYVAFAAVGLWLGGSPAAIQGLIEVINSYIPGLIGDADDGLISHAQVEQITSGNSGVLAVTGGIALLAAAWTAIGFVTFARRAVRDIFGLPYDDRSYLLLKARDLLAAVAFGSALIVGSVLSALGTWSLRAVLALFGFGTGSFLYDGTVQVLSVLVSLLINAAALAALFWFLTGTSRRWRTIWPGALVGGIAITLLQLAAGLLLAYTPSNPLLATFAIFVGLLVWFRVMGMATLLSAAWIAVTAKDENVPLMERSEADRLREEHEALLLAAHVRLRTAEEARAAAPWYRRWRADRAVRQAVDELADVVAAAPPAPRRRGSLLE
ncbi:MULTISPECIES: YihY/virulence factor BrkB family protein [Microbacterium]|uniref:Membrane protein n=1 Tax=Microbacterium saccharophilum TaxID=1213358 RepID=A0A7Z7D2Y4_9MICO|nr:MULTISPECIES: YihY/virulence factor BrkB family protein [Microbacterium]SFI65250.1 membrane protein [Microbacterium saccharophilum]